MLSNTVINLKNPCSCCCINMGCGMPKVWPSALAFILDLSNYCPQLFAGGGGIISGTLTFNQACSGPFSPPPTCADLHSAGCAATWSSFFCGCIYGWCVDPADIPLCGPYISSVILRCINAGNAGFSPGAAGCPHTDPQLNPCLWDVQVVISRATFLPASSPCIAPAGDPPPAYHCVQDCGTCLWSAVLGAGVDECCATCPPCSSCSDHVTARCAAGQLCCSTGVPCPICPTCIGFHQCEGDCAPCNFCIQTDVSGGLAQDASCVGYCGGRLYGNAIVHLTATLCTSPGDIKGCNPISCPPDADNLNDFFLHIQCNNDYFQAACL